MPPDPNDPSSGALYNPFPPDALHPPPWYRSQTNEPDYPQGRAQITGGLVIHCAEGWAWSTKNYGMELNADHSEDLTVVSYLEGVVQEHGYPNNVELAQRRDVAWCDFFVVPQRIKLGHL
jgi:hypothetical protein